MTGVDNSMYNIEKLVRCMEDGFVVNDEDDLVFKDKFKEIVKHKILIEDCRKNKFYIEYEDLSMYWYAVGKFTVGIVDHENNKMKTYEITLQYTYPESDDYEDGYGDIPTVPTLVIECGDETVETLHIA